jgi:hypothetical protein
VDLPTYTNIWRIEKRLYKLYDFRLPAPLPITWIAVFAGITVPYVIFLIAVGLPFNHNLVWLYILPPGVLTWLTTRPVIENKRLPELVSSQLRYVAEPRTWCRMAPFAEKDEILVTARVWHSHPPKARPKAAKKAPAKARSVIREPQPAAVEAEELAPAEVRPVTARRPAARLAAARSLAARQKAAPQVAPPAPAPSAPALPTAAPPAPALPVPPAEPAQVQVQERASARRAPQRAKAHPEAQPEVQPAVPPSWSPWPFGPEPDAARGPGAGQMPGTDQPSAWTTPPPATVPDARALEVAHDSDTGVRGLDETPASFGPPSWPSPQANLLPLVRPRPEPAPFPEAGPFPEAAPFPEAGPFPDDGPLPEPEPAASTDPVADPQGPASPDRGSPPRFGPWTGLPRRHLSGLMTSLVRKPDRSPGSAQPPAEDSAQATGPAGPQPTAASARPRARWMLRAQQRPASAASGDHPAASAAGLLVPLASAAHTETPHTETPQAEAPQAEAPQAEVPQAEVTQAEVPQAEVPEVTAPAPAPQAPIAPRVVGVERERERPVLFIERALSGPGSRDEVSWRRQVKVVAGGHGPGKRDQEGLDRDRARLPLVGSYRIVVLGCTRGAGQTVTAMMTGHVLAVARGIPVAALDLTPGPASLAARRPPAVSVQELLEGQEAGQHAARVDVVADDGEDFPRLADMLAERYPLTMIDPAPTGLTRVLARADQLVLVAPASPDAATSLANTQQWLGAHGHGELAARAVTVVNGVSRRTKDDVLRAESVVRGRCRAIVRVPWDDLLSSHPGPDQQAMLQPQTKLAYTALAGVLVTSLAATHVEPAPGRNLGEHAD